jgi:hypothetical protein
LNAFFTALAAVARAAGRGDFEFAGRGVIQLIPWGEMNVQLHRLWTTEPGKGHGSSILRELCALADRHGVRIQIKATPFGRKPYPMDRAQLHAWYLRHGFEGTKRKMARPPRTPAPT